MDSVKVDEMIDKIRSNNLYLLQQTNPIQLATIQIDDNKYIHYIIDGQHRFNAILNLANELPNSYQNFVLHICRSEEDAINVFQQLIKGQEANYLLGGNTFLKNFRDSLQFRLREYLKKHYSEYFTSNIKNEYIYTVEGFLRELNEKNYFEKCNYNIPEKIVNFLDKKNSKFLKKVNYIDYIENNSNLFYKKEIDLLNKNINNLKIFSLKRNNFIDYLFSSRESKIYPKHNFREMKEKIPKKIKANLWSLYSNKNSKIKCPLCKTLLLEKNFQAGHIISEKNGGCIDISNLYPICKTCNLKMGSKDWKDYDNDSYMYIREIQENTLE